MDVKTDFAQSKYVKRPDINMLFLSYSKGYEAREHQFYELEVTLLGDGTQIINGISYPKRRGELHVIRPGDVHSLRTDGSLKTFLIQFSHKHISAEALSELGRAERALVTYLNNDECDAYENICNSLDILKVGDGAPDIDMIRKLLDVLLNIFFASFNDNRKKARTCSRDPYDKIQQIIDWMQMHYRTHINADDIAKQFHFNTAYLRRLFKERVGVSIMQYLKELRLEYAKNLLMTTSLKISEVCDRSGYRSMPTFISDFKQKYHHAPLAFREKFADDKRSLS